MVKRFVTGIILLFSCIEAEIPDRFFQIAPYSAAEFSPALGEKFNIPFRLNGEANVSLEILTPDGNVIRSYKARSMKPGMHHWIWDGRDRWGETVPDEAYLPRFTVESSGEKRIYDYRNTGGEVLNDLHRRLYPTGRISYRLPKAGRTLVRIGVKSGPLLRVLSNWTPRSAGEVRQQWDFRGPGGTDLHDAPFVAAISAYALPDHSIITRNNRQTNYIEYFIRHKLICHQPSKITQEMLSRDDKKISPHFYACRINERDPQIFLTLDNNRSKPPYRVENGHPVNVHVAMAPQDMRLMEGKQYEVSFYLDYRFLSEAEQGYLPLSWRYLPNNLKPGRHTLTVNLSAFDGKVATRSIKIMVECIKKQKQQ